jgi:DNA-binding beta-propeller fold protein YncE
MRLSLRPRLLLLLTLGAGLLGAGPAAAAGIAFAIDSAAASISVVDMARQMEIRRIPALREPHHLVLSPDGKDLIVGDTVGNQLLFLDPATGDIKRRLTVADPYQLGFSPDRKWLVVNGLARNQVDVYDAATYKLVKRFPLSSMPSHLVYSPDSAMVYVTLQGTDRLAAIDLNTLSVRWNQVVGKTPAGVLWNNGKLLVAAMGTDSLSVVEPADGRVLGRIVTGKGAHNLFHSPDKQIIYVNNRVAGTVVALDAATLKPLRTYAVPGGPDDMDFAPDGRIWITLRFAEKLAVLDPATGAIQTIDVGRSPHGIWLNPKAP